MKINIEDITVKTVDTKKLIEFLAIELNNDEELYIDRFAIFEDKFGIDTDCCFWEIEAKHIDNKIQPVIEVECRIKKIKPDGGYSMRMDKADFTKAIPLKDYFDISNEVRLIDFIRYNYNPRIEGNQRLLMKYIKNENTPNIHNPNKRNPNR